MAKRLSYPSWAFRRVSGFSANLNLGVQGSTVSRLHRPVSVGTYQGEDIWRFERDIVEGFATFISFGIARDDVFGNALEFLKCKAYTALVGTHSSFASKDPKPANAYILFVEVFLFVGS